MTKKDNDKQLKKLFERIARAYKCGLTIEQCAWVWKVPKKAVEQAIRETLK